MYVKFIIFQSINFFEIFKFENKTKLLRSIILNLFSYHVSKFFKDFFKKKIHNIIIFKY